MKRLTILLVQPALPGPGRPARAYLDRAAWLCEPAALTSLAAMVPEHDAHILDLRLEEVSALGRALRARRPDLVVVAPGAGEAAEARALLRVTKGLLGEGCFTLIAGQDPAIAPEDLEDAAVDAVALGDGEETLRDVARHLAEGVDPLAPSSLAAIAGLRYRDDRGERRATGARAPVRLDRLPPPARHLIAGYRKRYFVGPVGPVAAMRTARPAGAGAAAPRRMGVDVICDRLEIIPEDFVVFVDEDLGADAARLERLAEGITRREIRKFWAVQGRPEIIAERPDLLRALRDAGLALVILPFDAREADGVDLLLDAATAARSRQAAGALRALGVAVAAIFTVPPDLGAEDLARLREHARELGVALPIARAAARRGDARGAHPSADARAASPLPIHLIQADLPRGPAGAAWPGRERAAWDLLRRRPALVLHAIPGIARALGRGWPAAAAGATAVTWARRVGWIDP